MFRLLKSLFSTIARPEAELFPKPRAYRGRAGSGRSVSVIATGDLNEDMVLLFVRKIEKEDVVNGKLLPVKPWVKRRGGKRAMGLRISLKSAEVLHAALGKALKDAHGRQNAQELTNTLTAVIDTMHEQRRCA